MKLCILENDSLAPEMESRYGSYGRMFCRLFEQVGVPDRHDLFRTELGQYPDSYAAYDAVLLTGSRADSFSDEPWIVRLRQEVTRLLATDTKLLGVCFGHQLIGLCLGAPVSRAPQGWGAGRTAYEWEGVGQVHLLASHQDQVHALPPGARWLAGNAFCPVAAYAVEDRVLCVQPHPEFDEAYAAFLLESRRQVLGEERVNAYLAGLRQGHDGTLVARQMLNFVRGTAA